MASLKVSNVQINKFLDSAETSRDRVESLKLFQTVGPDTQKHRPPYVDSLTGGRSKVGRR